MLQRSKTGLLSMKALLEPYDFRFTFEALEFWRYAFRRYVIFCSVSSIRE